MVTRGHSWSLVVTRGHSWSLVLIRGHSWSFVVIRGHSWSLVVTRGHSWSFVVTRGHSWSLVVTRGHSCVLLDKTHTNNYFITQILPENIKILTGILPDFCLSFTVVGGGGGGCIHVTSRKNAKIKPKFHSFPSVNCFKTLHIS